MEELADGRQPDGKAEIHIHSEADHSSELDEGDMSECTQLEGGEAEVVPGSSSSGSGGSNTSVLTMASADLLQVVETSQKKIGRALLSEQTTALDRRFKKVDAHQAKILDRKVLALKQELHNSIDERRRPRSGWMPWSTTRTRWRTRGRRQRRKQLLQLVKVEEEEEEAPQRKAATGGVTSMLGPPGHWSSRGSARRVKGLLEVYPKNLQVSTWRRCTRP